MPHQPRNDNHDHHCTSSGHDHSSNSAPSLQHRRSTLRWTDAPGCWTPAGDLLSWHPGFVHSGTTRHGCYQRLCLSSSWWLPFSWPYRHRSQHPRRHWTYRYPECRSNPSCSRCCPELPARRADLDPQRPRLPRPGHPQASWRSSPRSSLLNLLGFPGAPSIVLSVGVYLK